jgi:hypothetical protein
MSEFNTAKGAFLLVAVVVSTMMLVVIIAIFSCAYLMVTGSTGQVCVSMQEFVKELIQMSFTAAIAFAGGRLSAPSTPAPKLPDKEK